MSKDRRLSIPLTEKLYQRFTKFPWGERCKVVTALLEQLCDMAESSSVNECMIGVMLGRVKVTKTNEELSIHELERAVAKNFKHSQPSEDD